EQARGAAVERARRGHAGLREVCSIMDQAYVAYDKLFAQERREELIPTVYLFARQPDFARFSRRLRVGDTENTLGYYLPGYRVLVFFDQDEPDPRRQGLLDQGSLETLMHETFHQWIHLYVP